MYFDMDCIGDIRLTIFFESINSASMTEWCIRNPCVTIIKSFHNHMAIFKTENGEGFGQCFREYLGECLWGKGLDQVLGKFFRNTSRNNLWDASRIALD